MQPLLFSEFVSTTKETWKAQAKAELRGRIPDADDWKIADSVSLNPYYTSAETQNKNIREMQDAQRKSTGWLNTPPIVFETAVSTNLRIRSSLSAGADAILLDLGNRSINECELVKTLHLVRLTDSFIYFSTDQNPADLYAGISRGAGYYLKGGIANDPVAQWMRKGNDLGRALGQIDLVLKQTKMMKDFRPIMIESHIYHDAGANAVQELAFMISSLVHCTDYLTDVGTTPLHALNRFFFSVSIGPDYLSEIAKLRALRFLYHKITRAYLLPDELCSAFVHTRTSLFYHSNLAPTTNLVRTTSEAMSSVIGGCDALTVTGYQPHDEFASHIAGNVSLLLSEEATMKQVADPASGSYLLENMSLQLADAAWDLFLRIEENGGIVNSFTDGFIQSEVEKARNEKIDGLRQSKIMIGVNKYQENNLTSTPASGKPASNSTAGKSLVFPDRILEEYLRENSVKN